MKKFTTIPCFATVILLSSLTISFNSIAQGDNVAIVDFGGPGCVSVSKKSDNTAATQAAPQSRNRSSSQSLSIKTSGDIEPYTAHILWNKFRPNSVDKERLLLFARMYEQERYQNSINNEFNERDLLRDVEARVKSEANKIPNGASYTASLRIKVNSKYDFDNQIYRFSGNGLDNSIGYIQESITFKNSRGQHLASDNYGISFSNGSRFVGLKMSEAEARSFKSSIDKYVREGGIPAKFYFTPKSARVYAGAPGTSDKYTIIATLDKLELFESETSSVPFRTYTGSGT